MSKTLRTQRHVLTMQSLNGSLDSIVIPACNFPNVPDFAVGYFFTTIAELSTHEQVYQGKSVGFL